MVVAVRCIICNMLFQVAHDYDRLPAHDDRFGRGGGCAGNNLPGAAARAGSKA